MIIFIPAVILFSISMWLAGFYKGHKKGYLRGRRDGLRETLI
jgi:Sec-independent protein secretion pathway component TatC